MQHDYQQILVVLSAALGLSFTIERILEVLKKIFDNILFRIEALTPRSSFQAEHVIETIESQHKKDEEDSLAEEFNELQQSLANDKNDFTPAQKARMRARMREIEKTGVETEKTEQEEQYSQNTVFVDTIPPADRMKIMRTFWLQILGTFAGVVVCAVSHFGLFSKLAGNFSNIPLTFDYLFTGILIGAGSQPMHFLIEFITKRKITTLKTDSTEEDTVAEEKINSNNGHNDGNTNNASNLFQEIGIQYRGGIDLSTLEHVHHRPTNPDLIVYHHTAMHSDTSFADVVKVIKDKGWLTGYHCVVLKDGSFHPFCRWDRYGNHAKGFNLTSLGIAFNGNFETNPLDEYANPNGQYGLLAPSEEQLFAAAKIIVLWAFIYNINVNSVYSSGLYNRISSKNTKPEPPACGLLLSPKPIPNESTSVRSTPWSANS